MSRAQLLLCLLGITVGFFLNDAEARSARRLPTEGIVGGDYAHKNQFPYHVSLQAYDDSFCGGSILSKRYVITAAHCVVEDDNSFTDDPIKVVAGTNDLNSKSNKIVIDVVKVFVPKEYDPTVLEADKIPIGDIAILKLKENFPIRGNSQLGIVELPKKSETYEGKKAIISGYGLNEIEVVTDPKTGEDMEVNGKSYDKLRYAKANVLSYKACRRIFSSKQVKKSHICAHLVQRSRKHPEGVCTGDSGGPLVYDGVQIGVLSISPSGCREDIESALYTRVSSYVEFINKAINDQADVNIRTKTLEILDY